MADLDPVSTTIGDLCTASLRESGRFGHGQTPSSDDINAARSRVQWMLQQWNRKRFLIYHLVTYFIPQTTGQLFYTIGPGGDINTDVPASPWTDQFNNQFGTGVAPGSESRYSQRPDKIESAFLRQITQSQPNQIDYPLMILHSMEDYNRIALKQLQSFPGWIFYDPAWPLGHLYAWPVAQANIYALGICIKEQLPIWWPNLAGKVLIPYEYYAAILYNLALRMRAYYSIPSFPGDMLPGMARDSLEVLRTSNAAIAQLAIPGDLNRPGIYNIFSDRSY